MVRIVVYCQKCEKETIQCTFDPKMMGKFRCVFCWNISDIEYKIRQGLDLYKSLEPTMEGNFYCPKCEGMTNHVLSKRGLGFRCRPCYLRNHGPVIRDPDMQFCCRSSIQLGPPPRCFLDQYCGECWTKTQYTPVYNNFVTVSNVTIAVIEKKILESYLREI